MLSREEFLDADDTDLPDHSKMKASESTDSTMYTGRCCSDALRSYGSIEKIAQEVAAEHEVKLCVVSFLDSKGCISKASCFSSDPSIPPKALDLNGTDLFKMMVKRDAPIVVEDIQDHQVWNQDVLVKQSSEGNGVGCDIRFYLELPLKMKHSYCGVICLVDDKPRSYKLCDTESLALRAKLLVDAIFDCGDFDSEAGASQVTLSSDYMTS